MSHIHVLPPALVSKIAAGEVIERPAYVVKELLENALDAGATQIVIEIFKGGLESIAVIDNGEGMSSDDLFLSWQRHTTSKLSPDSDLTIIEKLGFRGEALSSIAAVSDLTIQSRRHDEPSGNMIHVRNGRLLENSAIGMAPGTIVKVEQIFVGLPGRQKFLGSAQTEWKHTIRIIEGQALAYPHVRFTLKHNGRLVFDAPAQTMNERMAKILGAEVAEQSFPFQMEDPYASIIGFMGTPQLSFHTNIPSHLVVNQRVVKNAALIQTMKESYRGLLKVEATPFFLLYINVPLQAVDVNVHPRKEEVKFLNERELSASLGREIVSTAKAQSLSYRWSTPEGDTKSFAAKNVRSDVVASLRKAQTTTPMMQLHNLYILLQTDEGMVLIDQHAAHERVLYEKLSESYVRQKEDKKIIHFSEPKKLQLPLSQFSILEEHLLMLKDLGFTLEAGNDQSYLIHAVPEFFKDRNPLQLFQEILSDLEDGDMVRSIDKHTNRMLSFLACRMAIKGGDHLTQEKMHQLVLELGNTKTSYTCPHGRPTHIEVTLSDLEKAFGRVE